MRFPYLSIPSFTIFLLGLFSPATLALAQCPDCYYILERDPVVGTRVRCAGVTAGHSGVKKVRNALCHSPGGNLGDSCSPCGEFPVVGFSGGAEGGSIVLGIDGILLSYITTFAEPASGVAQGLADQINSCEVCTFAATAEGGGLTISGATAIDVWILDPGLNQLTGNVPDGVQAGMCTTGALRQLVPTLSPRQTCTARFWVGKRSDGVGTWGSWYLQLASGPWVETLLNGFLSFQIVEWQQYQKSFRVPVYFPVGTISLQLTGYSGFEVYDLVELDCGGGNLIVNGSFEIPALLDGRWSAFSNPPPAFWTVIPGAGPFNPNEVQFNNSFP